MEVISGTRNFQHDQGFSQCAAGQEQHISQQMLQDYIEVNKENARRLSFDADYTSFTIRSQRL